MTTTNEQKQSKSLCRTCKNYILDNCDKYESWCICYKDIIQAIRDEKIIIENNREPIDRSIHYDVNGLVYCEGYTPKQLI